MASYKVWSLLAIDKDIETDEVKWLFLEPPSSKVKKCIISQKCAIELLRQGHRITAIYRPKAKFSLPTFQHLTLSENITTQPKLLAGEDSNIFNLLPSVNSYIRFFYRTKEQEATAKQRNKLIQDGKALLGNLETATHTNGWLPNTK